MESGEPRSIPPLTVSLVVLLWYFDVVSRIMKWNRDDPHAITKSRDFLVQDWLYGQATSLLGTMSCGCHSLSLDHRDQLHFRSQVGYNQHPCYKWILKLHVYRMHVLPRSSWYSLSKTSIYSAHLWWHILSSF